MSVHHGDCLEVMAELPEASVDAIVTDPPYGLEFMGKEWDRPWAVGFSQMGIEGHRQATPSFGSSRNPMCRSCRKHERGSDKCLCERPDFDETPATASRQYGEWSRGWATAALRVAKPGAYLLAFGGTRTVHRMTVALEDAGWIIRDMLVWAYAQGFPKSRALLKPAWEPIVMARKPGPLRELDIDGCRIAGAMKEGRPQDGNGGGFRPGEGTGPRIRPTDQADPAGRWPANVVLTDPIFDGDTEGVVGGGETTSGSRQGEYASGGFLNGSGPVTATLVGDTGTYSRFFLIPKASRSDREPVMPGMLGEEVISVWGGAEDDLSPGKKSTKARRNAHPTVKPTDLMRHLVRLVTPAGGTVLDPFLGSGTTALAAEQEGRVWVGIEREAEYVAIAEARLAGWQRGLGLSA